jgi:Fic-DOC domain mobile mystery protein B
MGLDLEYGEGQTPLDEDEKDGLLIPAIATRAELDEFEQQNIEKAIQWSLASSIKADTVFTENFIPTLHKRMYGEVWKWAGEFRKTNKNIGVDKWQISTELRYLVDDAKYWLTNKTYNPEEMTIRFKHRLVSIHCFPNGNGRHSRLISDIVIEKIFNLPVFTWGAANLVKQGDTRTAYLNAMRAADSGNFEPLIKFARS